MLFDKLDRCSPLNCSINAVFRKYLSIIMKGKIIGYSRSREISKTPSIVFVQIHHQS